MFSVNFGEASIMGKRCWSRQGGRGAGVGRGVGVGRGGAISR